MPQALGHRAFLRLRAHDRGDQLVYQPVAHAFILHSSVPARRLAIRLRANPSLRLQADKGLRIAAWVKRQRHFTKSFAEASAQPGTLVQRFVTGRPAAPRGHMTARTRSTKVLTASASLMPFSRSTPPLTSTAKRRT